MAVLLVLVQFGLNFVVVVVVVGGAVDGGDDNSEGEHVEVGPVRHSETCCAIFAEPPTVDAYGTILSHLSVILLSVPAEYLFVPVRLLSLHVLVESDIHSHLTRIDSVIVDGEPRTLPEAALSAERKRHLPKTPGLRS